MTLEISYIALFSALIAVCTWIAIPLPSGISVTLQTFAVVLCAALLGAKRGVAAVIVYIGVGAAGAPVFTGFRGGIGILGGVTGGYIVGFIFTALIVGIVCEKSGMKTVPAVISMIAGIVVCYIFGTAWFCIYFKGERTVGSALLTCVVPYLPFDAVKIALAAFLSKKLYKRVGIYGDKR